MRLAILMNSRSLWSRDIANRLAGLGVEVTVIHVGEIPQKLGYLSKDDTFHQDGVAELERTVHAVRTLSPEYKRPSRLLAGGRRLRGILREIRPDVLVTLYGGSYAALAYFSGFRPYAVYLVGSDVHMLSRATRMMTRAALSRATLVLANGKHLAEVAERGLTRKRVATCCIGVDTDKFAPGVPSPDRLRVVCTRGFEAVYNNESIITGLSQLEAVPRDVEVTFVSTGSLLPRAKELAGTLLGDGRRINVAFLGGVDDATVLRSLQESEIYVSMSRSDGTSISLLESMSCGLFPILSDIPANRDWIDPEANNGLLVPLDDPAALAAALDLAIRDDALRARAREYNRHLVLRRADGVRSAQDLRDRLQGLLDHAQSARAARAV